MWVKDNEDNLSKTIISNTNLFLFRLIAFFGLYDFATVITEIGALESFSTNGSRLYHIIISGSHFTGMAHEPILVGIEVTKKMTPCKYCVIF